MLPANGMNSGVLRMQLLQANSGDRLRQPKLDVPVLEMAREDGVFRG